MSSAKHNIYGKITRTIGDRPENPLNWSRNNPNKLTHCVRLIKKIQTNETNIKKSSPIEQIKQKSQCKQH